MFQQSSVLPCSIFWTLPIRGHGWPDPKGGSRIGCRLHLKSSPALRQLPLPFCRHRCRLALHPQRLSHVPFLSFLKPDLDSAFASSSSLFRTFNVGYLRVKPFFIPSVAVQVLYQRFA